MPILDGSARELIDDYNRSQAGRGYNRTATEVYKARCILGDPLSVRKNAALQPLRDCRLSVIDLGAIRSVIMSAYDCLALSGTLHPVKQSHVGATKTIHWLVPDLFLIVDSNVANSFRDHFGVKFRNSTQPGDCSDKYFTCLQEAQREIQFFGVERFRPGGPPHT
jgi:hypothetical protein